MPKLIGGGKLPPPKVEKIGMISNYVRGRNCTCSQPENPEQMENDAKRIFETILPTVNGFANDNNGRVTVGKEINLRTTKASGVLTTQIIVVGKPPIQKLEICTLTRAGIERYRAKLDVPEDMKDFNHSVLLGALQSSIL